MAGSDARTTVRMCLLPRTVHTDRSRWYTLCYVSFTTIGNYTESVSPRDEQARKMSADFTSDCACQGEESKCFPCFLIKQLVIA